ncbi:MAG: hypothetical protein II028_09295, partial [Clostridia bacterium]|nr:hypothetical protein [Clostridia bacterium]
MFAAFVKKNLRCGGKNPLTRTGPVVPSYYFLLAFPLNEHIINMSRRGTMTFLFESVCKKAKPALLERSAGKYAMIQERSLARKSE